MNSEGRFACPMKKGGAGIDDEQINRINQTKDTCLSILLIRQILAHGRDRVKEEPRRHTANTIVPTMRRSYGDGMAEEPI